VDPTDPEYIWSRAMTTAPPSTENLQKAFGYIAGSSEGVTAHKLMTAVFAIGRETNAENVEKQLIRIEKDLELQSNSVRSDLNQDRTFAFEVFAEYMRQEVTAGLEIHTRVRPGGFKHTAIQTKKTVLRDPVVRDPLFNKVSLATAGMCALVSFGDLAYPEVLHVTHLTVVHDGTCRCTTSSQGFARGTFLFLQSSVSRQGRCSG
jgi:hypothetical protein